MGSPVRGKAKGCRSASSLAKAEHPLDLIAVRLSKTAMVVFQSFPRRTLHQVGSIGNDAVELDRFKRFGVVDGPDAGAVALAMQIARERCGERLMVEVERADVVVLVG